jgi:CubicO group peptidase (beta-lactamase class C family)
MTTEAPAAGTTTLSEVERIFRDQVKVERLHPGAALAVYHHGRLVLDVVEGLADNQRGKTVEPDTLFVLFSSTKPLASVSVLQQVERGKAQLDDPVAKHWPGFAANGKESVTIRHILTHRGGFPRTPAELPSERWLDWDAVVAAMENAKPDFEPGTTGAYHALNHGWVCAELIRRIDGRTFPDYLRAEITGPLGMDDTYVGLPAELEERVAKLHAMEDVDEQGRGTVRTFNRPEVHRAVVPAGCGISTARDMARFYAALSLGGALDGVRIIGPETLADATAIHVDDFDRALNMPMRRGLGFNLGGLGGANLRYGHTATARTFGHGGAGTSVCWAEQERELAMVFIPNGFRAGEGMIERCRVLSDAVRAACS